MKNILVVGDSFSYGQGCSDRPWNQKPYKASPSQFAWPALLQKELPEYNIINISYPGNSIPGTFNDVVKFRETVPQIPIHMVLMAVTSINRMIVAKAFWPDETQNWVLGSPQPTDNPKEYATAKEMFLKYLINDTIIENNAHRDILALYTYCQEISGSALFWSVEGVENLFRNKRGAWDIIKSLNFKHMMNLEYLTEEDKRNTSIDIEFIKKWHAEDSHPSDFGHQHYFETYIKPILIPKIHEWIALQNHDYVLPG
jgi:hypothetical protein